MSLPVSPSVGRGLADRLFYVNSPHFKFLSLHGTQMEPLETTVAIRREPVESRAQLDDPQFRSLPPFSLVMSPFRPLQTVYRPIFYTSRLLSQRLFSSFRARPQFTTPLKPAPAPYWECGEGIVHNLECGKIFEFCASIDYS